MRVAKLADVAPAIPAKRTYGQSDTVWVLGLDKVEADSGNVSFKELKKTADAGPSVQAFDTGNVLYSKLRPYLNKVVLPDESGLATTELVTLRPDPDLLDRNFLAHYLRSPRFVAWATTETSGAKMPRVVMKAFWEQEIPLPPLQEQKRIAAILDKADELRTKRKEAIAELDKLQQSVFLDMFGDPVTNPKGWQVSTLGEIIKVSSGKGLTASRMDQKGTHKVYGGNGVNGFHSEYMFDEQRLVIGRVGVYCGAIHFTDKFSWVTDNALVVEEIHKDLNTVFLRDLLKIVNLNQYAGQVAQPLISGARIYPVITYLPSLIEQNRYSEVLKTVHSVATHAREHLHELDNLFASLQTSAFKGEL